MGMILVSASIRTEDTDYPDTCRQCGFQWPCYAPVDVYRYEPGSVRAFYICADCDNQWACYWSDRGYDK